MPLTNVARAFAFATLIACASTGALAHSVTVGSLTISDLWMPAPPPGAPTAAGYLTITNSGGEPDRLIGASSPMAAQGALHKMETNDGVMSMTPIDGGIEIPPGGTVTLAPGGVHFMFVSLKGTLKEGDMMPVRLTFAKAGSVDTFLHVMAVGARSMGAAAMEPMGSMGHDAMAPAGRGGQ